MALESSHQLAGFVVPNFDRAIEEPCRQQAIAGTDIHRSDYRAKIGDHPLELTILAPPGFDIGGQARTRAMDGFAVGAEGQGVDDIRAGQDLAGLAGFELPDPDGFIDAAADGLLIEGGEDDAIDRSLVTAEAIEQLGAGLGLGDLGLDELDDRTDRCNADRDANPRSKWDQTQSRPESKGRDRSKKLGQTCKLRTVMHEFNLMMGRITRVTQSIWDGNRFYADRWFNRWTVTRM